MKQSVKEKSIFAIGVIAIILSAIMIIYGIFIAVDYHKTDAKTEYTEEYGLFRTEANPTTGDGIITNEENTELLYGDDGYLVTCTKCGVSFFDNRHDECPKCGSYNFKLAVFSSDELLSIELKDSNFNTIPNDQKRIVVQGIGGYDLLLRDVNENCRIVGHLMNDYTKADYLIQSEYYKDFFRFTEDWYEYDREDMLEVMDNEVQRNIYTLLGF